MKDERRAEDCFNFTTTLEKVCKEVGMTNDEIQDAINYNLNAFMALLDCPDSPDSQFEFLGQGAFKEAYHPIGYKGRFVIKFATEDNPTDAEAELLDKALESEVLEFFLPSFYMRIASADTVKIPSYLTTDAQEYAYYEYRKYYTRNGKRYHTYAERRREDWEPYYMTHIVMQPFAKPLCDIGHTNIIAFGDPSREELYNDHPLVDENGNKIPYNVAHDFANLTNAFEWWQQALRVYGYHKCKQFFSFAKENNMWDLHYANIGYIVRDNTEYPIIMDWMSA